MKQLIHSGNLRAYLHRRRWRREYDVTLPFWSTTATHAWYRHAVRIYLQRQREGPGSYQCGHDFPVHLRNWAWLLRWRGWRGRSLKRSTGRKADGSGETTEAYFIFFSDIFFRKYEKRFQKYPTQQCFPMERMMYRNIWFTGSREIYQHWVESYELHRRFMI